MRKRIRFTLAGISIMLFAFTPSGMETDTYVGYAYEKGNREPVYTEVFTDRFENGKHIATQTNYFDPARQRIAQRMLNFSKSRFAPDYTTEDLRSGYTEGAEVKGDKVRVFRRKDKSAALEEKLLSIPQPYVIDGGFSQFIKANWSKLEQGKELAFNFTVAAHLDYYLLRAVRVDEKNGEMTIRIEPDQRVIRWLAPAIYVRYDVNTRRIVSYEGKSNIADEHGTNQNIKLIYPDKGP